MNKLSIILTAYNEGSFVDPCLIAVKKSLKRDAEILFIDDCSTDGTLEAARKHSGVSVIHNDVRLGVSQSRNLGAKAASGDVLCFLDAHVWPSSGSLDLLGSGARALDGIIVPSFTNFKPVGFKGGQGMLPSLPANYGGGPTFAQQRWWFYMHVERYDKKKYARRTGCFAVGVTVSRRIFNTLGGWMRLPGYWSGSDVALGVKAWLLDVPIYVEPDAHLFHAIKSTTSHKTPKAHEILNRYYAASVLFCRDAYKTFWEPGLLKKAGPPSKPEALTSPEAEAERDHIRMNSKKSDEDFLVQFVYPRLEGERHEGS